MFARVRTARQALRHDFDFESLEIDCNYSLTLTRQAVWWIDLSNVENDREDEVSGTNILERSNLNNTTSANGLFGEIFTGVFAFFRDDEIIVSLNFKLGLRFADDLYRTCHSRWVVNESGYTVEFGCVNTTNIALRRTFRRTIKISNEGWMQVVHSTEVRHRTGAEGKRLLILLLSLFHPETAGLPRSRHVAIPINE